MSTRSFYLGNGRVRTISAGRFRGDDDVRPKIETEHLNVQDNDRAGARPAIVLDADGTAPLTIHFDSQNGQAGLTIIDDHYDSTALQVNSDGKLLATGNATIGPTLTTSTLEVNNVSFLDKADGSLPALTGKAFDKGAWAHAGSAEAVPNGDTIVTRNATKESVNVANLRVTSRTQAPKQFDNAGTLEDNPNGLLSGDGLPQGLLFDRGTCVEKLNLDRPTRDAQNAIADPGAYILAQSIGDNEHPVCIYRLGFDPDKQPDEDGLRFTVPASGGDAGRYLGLHLNNGDVGMGDFHNIENVTHVSFCTDDNGAKALHVRQGDTVVQDLTVKETAVFEKSVAAESVVAPAVTATTLTVAGATTFNNGATFNVGALVSNAFAEGNMHVTGTLFSKGMTIMTGDAQCINNLSVLGKISGPSMTVHAKSLAVHDHSVFIGSARFSYDRATHEVTLHRLKIESPPHIPVYLAGRGVTTGDISGTPSDMTVTEWVEFAQTHFSEPILDLDTVFPHTNTADWVEVDAPVPLLKAWALGADSDIDVLENEMDSAEIRLTNAETHIATLLESSYNLGGELFASDATLYIGSARISFKRSTYELVIKVLKQDQIPTYLSSRGYTVADLPSGRTINTMSALRWLNAAKSFTGDDTLKGSDIFVGGQLNLDWDNVDAPIPLAVADIAALDTRVTTLEAGGGGGGSPAAMDTVYVDASYDAGLGASDGSLHKPYVSLKTALETKLASGTTSLTFKVAPGEYTGAVSIDRAVAEQSFVIEGSGSQCTFVQAGTSFAAGASSNVLYLRDFKDVTIKNLCIRYGAYGLYPRSCDSCTVQNVRFVYLGSDGQADRHDMSGTQAEQAAFWASGSTSNGGACRIRSCTAVHVTDCSVDLCARGLRIQDCGSETTVSIVSNNRISRTLESAIYLAAGSYTGTDGCVNFKVSSNNVNGTMNNGLLSIGGAACSFVGNTVIGCANAGIMQWHGVDHVYTGNAIINCNRIQHNGVGSLGDAHANFHIDGSTNIRAGTYIALVHDNTIADCNQGRADAVYGIRIGDISYPAASAKISMGGNHIDAATRLHNPHSVTTVALADPSGSSYDDTVLAGRVTTLETDVTALEAEDVALDGRVTTLENAGGGSISNPLMVSSTDTSTGTVVSIRNEATSAGKIAFEMEIDAPPVDGDTWNDVLYRTHTGDHRYLFYDVNRRQHQGGVHDVTERIWGINQYGNIIFFGKDQAYWDAPSLSASTVNFNVRGTTQFDNASFAIPNLPTTDPSVSGRLFDDQGVVKISAGSSLHLHEDSPASGNPWVQLTNQTLVTMGPSNSNPSLTFRYIAPVGADRYDGRTIKFVLCNYKVLIQAGASEWATYAYTAGNGSVLTVLGGYKTDSGSGPVSFEIIWIDSLSRWMSTAHHNKRPGFE